MRYKIHVLKNLFKYVAPLSLIFSLCLTLGILLGVKLNKINNAKKKESGASLAIDNSRVKFEEILRLIDKDYVSEVDLTKFTNSSFQDMVEKLDPYSSYVDAKTLENDGTDGGDEATDSGSIGVSIVVIKGVVHIIAPIQDCPAADAGIRSGDVILKIDDEEVSNRGFNDQDILKKLKGQKGSKVLIKVKRKTEKEPLDFYVTRESVPLQYVSWCMLNSYIGYIRITYFAPNTNKDFLSAFNALVKSGMTKLVIDLRSNAGGPIEEAINIADKLLVRGELISYNSGRTDARNTKYYAKSQEAIDDNLKMLVIIDKGTAAAAEVLAGALQDNDRAIVVGERSFGRGSIQETITMHDGSQLTMTVAKIYTPSGRCIHKSVSTGFSEETQNMSEQYKQIGYFRSDTMHIDDKFKFRSVSGRTVFGGGGIVPDFIIIPKENSRPIYLDKIKPLLKQFAFAYANQNASVLTNMHFDRFLKNFDVPYATLCQLRAIAEKDGLLCGDGTFYSILQDLRIELKAYIAYNIWNEQAFHIIHAARDNILLKALSILEEVDILTHKVQEG